MSRTLPRPGRLLPALLLAVLATCAVAASTANAEVTWNITPKVKGAGTVTVYSNATYSCTGPADDRQTADCPAITGSNAYWFGLWLTATPPEGDGWTFVGWENCPGATYATCSYTGSSGSITAAPVAVFDDTAGPAVTATRTVSQSAERTVSFTLGSGEGAVSYECGIDGAQLAPCPATKTYTLPEGEHTFAARGIDASGNAGALETVAFHTVDTALVSGPSGFTRSKTAAFTFSTAGGSSFDCSLDGGAYTACATTDPGGRGAKSFAGLAEGAHTLKVRARNGDDVDRLPVTRTWTVDTVAPATTLDAASGPRQNGLSTGVRETFRFSSSESGGFECRVDGRAFAPCTSPATAGGLAPGAHSFEVRAVDRAGNPDASPARRTWTTMRDADRDGFAAGTDCDDGNAGINPGARDAADNGVDENCDGADAVNLDRDGDGIPRPADCDDANAAIRPGAADEPGDGADQDCDLRDAQLAAIPFTLRYEGSSWGRKASRFVIFAANGVPAGSTVEVTCKRCPKAARRIVRRNAKGLVKLKPLLRKIRAGAAIQVRVSRPGMLTTIRTLKVRSGKGPRLSVTCLAPGAAKASACP